MYKITLSHVNINNQQVSKSELYKILELDLSGISIQELAEMFKKLYGIPSNFSEYVVKKIKEYDKSADVNSFYYNGNTYWFDKNTRLGLMNLLSCGEDSIQVVLGDEIVKFDSNKFKSFLKDLEVYAGKCYIATAKHINSVQKLEKLEDTINYDYTLGYPDKITLSNE